MIQILSNHGNALLAIPDGTGTSIAAWCSEHLVCVGAHMRKDHPVAAAAATIALVALAGVASLAADDTSAPARTDPPNSAPASPPPAPPGMIILKSHEAEGILGKEVRSAAGENMGRIVDVLVDQTGQVRAAVIDFGGFLGVGSRKIAIDWNALTFPPPGDKAGRVTLEFTRDQVKAAPEYQEGKPVVVLGAQGQLESYPFQ
jgi:sporulation protein YlmC with PRC-barrel domain